MKIGSLSPELQEIARKNASAVLRRMASIGQKSIADFLDVAESTISKRKDAGEFEEIGGMLAKLGLKAVEIDRVCVRKDEYQTMTRIVSRALANEQIAETLLFNDPE